MVEKRLINGLAMMNTHQEIVLNVEYKSKKSLHTLLHCYTTIFERTVTNTHTSILQTFKQIHINSYFWYIFIVDIYIYM